MSYESMLNEMGLSADLVAERSADRSDCVPMPIDDYKFGIDDSEIQGEGVFATGDYEANEVIGAVRLGLHRTSLGYKTNHSDDPNAETVGLPDGGGYMRTLRPIKAGEEITIDYRYAIAEARRAEWHIIASEGVQHTFQNLVALIDKGADRMEVRTAIDLLEQQLLLMPQADHGLEHLFVDGLYIRVAKILKGTLFTTPEYREECILTMLQGRLVIITEDGAAGIVPPTFVLTKPGTKRVIFAADDVLAHTVHPNPDNERDIAKLEARIYGGSL